MQMYLFIWIRNCSRDNSVHLWRRHRNCARLLIQLSWMPSPRWTKKMAIVFVVSLPSYFQDVSFRSAHICQFSPKVWAFSECTLHILNLAALSLFRRWNTEWHRWSITAGWAVLSRRNLVESTRSRHGRRTRESSYTSRSQRQNYSYCRSSVRQQNVAPQRLMSRDMWISRTLVQISNFKFISFLLQMNAMIFLGCDLLLCGVLWCQPESKITANVLPLHGGRCDQYLPFAVVSLPAWDVQHL